MNDILTRYSKAENLVAPQANSLTTIVGNDFRIPYGFQDWLKRNIGVIPGKESEQYNRYLKDWYIDHGITEELVRGQVREDYIALLKQITISFKTEAEKVWATDIDFANDLDLEQVIPFYANKLKEIAIYLINKREAIKKAKLKYNMTGAGVALERLFYEYLLKAFTQRRFPGNEYVTNVTDVSVFNSLPELSAVSNGFKIEIEELYDNTVYFDKDPVNSSSFYFDLTADSVVNYLTTLNIPQSAFEWLYQTGFVPLCAENILSWNLDTILAQYKNGIPLSAIQSIDQPILNKYNEFLLTQKYIGETQSIISGGYFIPWEQDLILDIVIGNNWFYWPSGENVFTSNSFINIDPIPLSATNLITAGASAGLTYKDSDVVFVRRDNVLSGAWLCLNDTSSMAPTMSAVLKRGMNVFAFPFPGYGLSGDQLEWDGRSFDNIDQTFFYLDKDYQNAVYNQYWNTKTGSTSSLKSVYLNNTNLVYNNAKAAFKYDDADTITIRTSGLQDSRTDGIFTGDQQYAWLYKMVETNLPIKLGKNFINWPFETFKTTTNIVALSDQCSPLILSGINVNQYFNNSCAGTNELLSDCIYKLDSPNGNIVEGSWLSGALVEVDNLINSDIVCGASQPGISVKAKVGELTTFVWDTSATMTANLVFPHYEHHLNCPYRLEILNSLYTERPEQNKQDIDYNQWKKCTCKSIYYSPVGHPGSDYDQYDGMADFIIEISDPTADLSLNSWRDHLGHNYKTSEYFGWFRLSGPRLEPDVGWSSGNWVTYNGNSFELKANNVYAYYRHNLLRNNIEDVPYLITSYAFNNNHQKWMKLVYNKSANKWEAGTDISDMIINSGESLRYDRQSTRIFTISSYNASSLICTKYEIDNTNFVLSLPLSGWTYDDGQVGAKPYWAKAVDTYSYDTKYKGIDIWSSNTIFVNEYSIKRQPEYTDIILTSDVYLEYYRKGNTIIWVEPLSYKITIDDKKWCELLIDTNSVNNLDTNLYDFVVSATNKISPIVFDIVEDLPLQINYHSKANFQWIQPITNTSLGLPPTGGVYLPIGIGEFIVPTYPYANLTNRHFPTIASAPSVSNLYGSKDVGGYFVSTMLGVTVAITKRLTNEINSSKISNDPLLRGRTAIYQDLQKYHNDLGFTGIDQMSPVSTVEIDSSWMKSGVEESFRNGIIVDAKDHQAFMPYETKYEIQKYNDNGLVRQGDTTDPWFGADDSTWENSIDYPSNWRKQNNILKWYSNQVSRDLQIFQWKTDIYGNTYALLKKY